MHLPLLRYHQGMVEVVDWDNNNILLLGHKSDNINDGFY